MEFKITNSDGSSTYWTSGSTNVAVSAGLFRYPLGTPNEAAFQAIDWSSIVPYVEVTIDGITLPREPLYSSPYSLHSKTSEGRITGTLNANIAGIGTSLPQSKLHVLDGDIRISTSAGQSSRGIIFQDGSIQNTASGSTQWAVSGSHVYNTNVGNIGIGTSVPGQKLEVIGTAKATAFQGDGSALTNLTAANLSGSLGAALNAGGFKITNLAAPSAAQDSATKNYVDNLTGGGLSAAVLSATQTFTGQNGFSNQITVSSNLFVNAGVYLTNAVPASTSYTLYNDAGTLKWNGNTLATGSSVSGTTGYVAKFTASNAIGDSAMYESGANIGIGTTNPLQKLQVAGDINVETGYGIRVNNTAASGQYLRGDGTRFIASAIQSSDLPGSLSGFANPAASIGLTASNGSATTAMRSDAAPAISQAIVPTWTGIHTFSNAGYSALFTGGSVGIGTTSPGAKADIKGMLRITDMPPTPISGRGLELWFETDTNYSSINSYERGVGSLPLKISASSHTFSIAGTPKMVIDNSGHVGIGTTSPDTGLHIKSDRTFLGTYANPALIESTWYSYPTIKGQAQAAIDFLATNYPATWGVGMTEQVDGGGGFAVYSMPKASGYPDIANRVLRLVISSSTGNVGIGGTASPGQKLYVSGGNIGLDSGNWLTWATGGGAASDTGIDFGFGTMIKRISTDGRMQLNSQAGKFEFTGNVGIGTTGPNNKLEVTGGNIALGTAGSIVDYGYGVSGREPNAGKIGYGTFVAGTLNIVGGGTAVPRIVDIWENLRLNNNGYITFADGSVQRKKGLYDYFPQLVRDQTPTYCQGTCYADIGWPATINAGGTGVLNVWSTRNGWNDPIYIKLRDITSSSDVISWTLAGSTSTRTFDKSPSFTVTSGHTYRVQAYSWGTQPSGGIQLVDLLLYSE